MTYYSISALINALCGLLLGLFALYKNPKAKLNRSLFFWCLAVSFWSSFYFIWQLEDQESQALLWTRLLMLGAVWVPVAYLRVVLIFLDIKKRYKYFLYFNYVLSVIFSVLLLTPSMVARVEPTAGFPFWPKPGLAYIPFLIMFLGVSAYSAYLSYKALKTEPSLIKKSQIKYMLFGIAISIICGSTNYFLWYDIPIKPYGNLLSSTYVFFTIYAILRYRLMDIRIVARKAFIYIGVTAFTYGTFCLIIWVYNIFLGDIYAKNAYITGIFISIILVVCFYYINNLLRKIANKYFFFSLYSYQKTINRLSEKLNYYTDLNRIINSIVVTIKKTMQLDRAGVLLINHDKDTIHYQVARVVGFNEKNGIGLVQDNFLTMRLQKTQAPLVRDELTLLAESARTMKEKENFYKLSSHMKQIEASLCLPLMSSNKLIGIIVLGSKVSGDAYTKEDLELLDTLANQAGVAVENARLYKEVQDFNKTLRQKVNEQTKDIQTKANELEEKNKNLEELLNMKSDFLRVVNHQLNTPISIMKNSLFMIKDKTFSVAKGLKFIEAGLKRIDETINDFWSAFALEGQKIKMNPEEVDIEKLVSDLIEEKKNLEIARKRKLDLKIAKPNFRIPILLCDPKEIIQALSNLLENAIYYTSSGYVEVSFAQEKKDKLKILITDTGSGIPKKDQKNLFKKFSRGSRSTRFYANGSGLGLYIAQKIIEGNNGQLKLEKTEVDKGTTFSITLPIHKSRKGDSKGRYIRDGSEKKYVKKPGQKGKKKTILFIEDEKSFADIYSNYFNKKGYNFKVVYDAESAPGVVKKIKSDLILADIVIPQKNPDGSISNVIAEQGWGFIKEAKEDQKTKNIPIIVFTNLNSDKDRQRAKKLGAASYVVKNQVDPEKLAKIIEETLNK